MRSLGIVLALALPALSQGFDDDTLRGMDAEIAGDWLAAVEAFERAASGDKPPRDARMRLQVLRKRAKVTILGELKDLMKRKDWAELAYRVALARRVDPKGSWMKSAAAAVERAGLTLPDLTAEPADPKRPYASRHSRTRVRDAVYLGAVLPRAEKLIDGGLDYLVRRQRKDGSWAPKEADAADEQGITALALLALCARGTEGLEGPRGEAARKAADYLVSKQDAGGAWVPERHRCAYVTTFATEALAEYAVLARRTEALRKALEGARDNLEIRQAKNGGWRYKRGGDDADTSVTCRVISAFQALRRAGLKVPGGAYSGAARFVRSMRDDEYGIIGYSQKGGWSSRPEGLQDAYPADMAYAMTAAGTLVLLYAGDEVGTLRRGLRGMEKILPRAKPADMYYWNLGARAFRAAWGFVPRAWYEALLGAAAKCRAPDGSFRNAGPWREGLVYSTSMTVLALAAPYREPRRAGKRPAGTAALFQRTRKATVDIESTVPHVASGLYLSHGQTVRVIGFNRIAAYADAPFVGIDGDPKPVRGAKKRVRGAPFACLLGQIGAEGKPFRIPESKPVKVKGYGPLYLLVNDAEPADNRGKWSLRVTLVRD